MMDMKLYTVKELAELLNVSKSTIQRALQSANILPDEEGVKHTRSYSLEKALEVIRIINPDFDLSSIVSEPIHEPMHEAIQTASLNQTPPHAPMQTESEPIHTDSRPIHTASEPHQTASQPDIERELLQSMVKTLQEQLSVKDRQLELYAEQLSIKDKQIEDYSQRLAEAMELTKGQQYLNAADKVERLTAANEDTEETIIPDEIISEAVPEDVPEEPITVTSQAEEKPPEKKKSIWRRLFG